MLDCLVNYIGLRGCGETAPGSGLYINNLPGIPRELLDKIATADQGTYKQAWLDIQNNTVQELEIDLVRGFSSRYKTKTLMRSIDLGSEIDTTNTTVAATEFRGFSFDIHKNLPSGYQISSMVGISADSLRLYLSATVANPIPVKIYDALGNLAFTYNLDAADQVTGWNVIPVNQVFLTSKITAVYDATDVNSKDLILSPTINDTMCACMHDLYGQCAGHITGLDTGGFLSLATINEGTNTYGLTATINLVCNYQRLVCSAKMQFAKPLQLLLGSKVMEAALYTNRFGRFNTVDRKVTEQLKDDYYQDYITALDLVLKGIELDMSDPCIVCDPPLYTTYVKP